MVVRGGSRRGLFYARVKLWEALVEGLLAFTIARLAGVPGAAAFGIWVALWSFLPVAGVFIGALPIVVFAGAHSIQRAIIVALVLRRDRIARRGGQSLARAARGERRLVRDRAGGVRRPRALRTHRRVALHPRRDSRRGCLSELGPEEVAEAFAAPPADPIDE